MKPVAWLIEESNYPSSRSYSISVIIGEKPPLDVYESKPLYLMPPKLTEEYIEEVIYAWFGVEDSRIARKYKDFVRAIEAKIRGESDETR